ITVHTPGDGTQWMSSAGSCCTSARISSTAFVSCSAATGPRLRCSGIVAPLAEQVQCLLYGAVGEGEQDGLVGCLVHDGLPARDDEDIARLPVDDEVRADARAAPPFDGDEDRR